MANEDFDVIAKEEFKFLELNFECKLQKCKKEDWGYELVYLNKTTAVKVTYEFQEAYIFIMLYRLVDGTLIENPGNIKENTTLNGYGLDDVINYYDPSSLIKPIYQYGEDSDYYDQKKGLMLYVNAFANNLKKFGTEVLKGDFRIFKELDKVVKDRANRYR